MFKVCFFGIYDPEYSRNRVLMSGLRQNEVVVIECRSEKKGFLKYFDLIKKHWKIRKEYNVLFVAFPGFQTMILARFLTSKKIIFDSFAPIYESQVLDRKKISTRSLRAKYYWLLDWLSLKLADKVLLDTSEHIKFVVDEFGISENKFERIFVGTDSLIFYPIKKELSKSEFIVHFHGSNISLQGIEIVLESARILEKEKDIQFNIIGSSIKKQYEDQNFKNVNFIKNVFYKNLVDYINQAHVCLGIFGDTEKTQRVIPNKVYECVACAKPVITADTFAIRELFDESSLCLASTASPKALVEAILELKNNLELREKLAKNGYNRFTENAKPKILAGELIKIINEKL